MRIARAGFLFSGGLWGLGLLAGSSALAAPRNLAHQLERIREQVATVERELVRGTEQQRQARVQVRRFKQLIELRKKQKVLGKQRVEELGRTLGELEVRRAVLQERIQIQRTAVRQFLQALDASRNANSADRLGFALPEQERLEAPRRALLARLANKGLSELETLRIDVTDANQLERKIQEERQILANLSQELQEEESVLALNQQIQMDWLKRTHSDRVERLRDYHKLKDAELQVEKLITAFSARKELERAVDQEKQTEKAMRPGVFAGLKGKLPLPVATAAKLVAPFGKSFDPRSKLTVFRKGIELAVEKSEPVRAVSIGKIAYIGELGDLGQIAIVDHGEHYFSLVGRLSQVSRKVGDSVKAGDLIGLASARGDSLYFEIRSGNVPVNPLQWFSNSFSF